MPSPLWASPAGPPATGLTHCRSDTSTHQSHIQWWGTCIETEYNFKDVRQLFFFPTTVVCDLQLMHWPSQMDGMHFSDMTCFSFFLPPLVWTDELYPRVDLGSWVTHVHRRKLSAPMAEGRLDLLDTVKMHYSIPALLCSSFLSSLFALWFDLVCRRVNHWKVFFFFYCSLFKENMQGGQHSIAGFSNVF